MACKILTRIRQRFCHHRYDALEPLPGYKNVDGWLLPIFKGTCVKCGKTISGTMVDLVEGRNRA